MAGGDGFSAEGGCLFGALGELAWRLQRRAAQAGRRGNGVELTLPRTEVLKILDGEQALYCCASADLLEDAEKRGLIRLDYDESRGNYKVRLRE